MFTWFCFSYDDIVVRGMIQLSADKMKKNY